MRLPAFVLVAAALGLASAFCSSCTRISQKTTLAPGGVPSALLGEWSGTWTSERAANPGSGPRSAGTVRVLLQTFADHPVVRLQIDNPCLRPRNYTFAFVGQRFELRAEGEPVFVAVLAEDLHSMAGTFACAEDRGSWSVAKAGELPPVGDVSGTWFGSFESTEPLTVGTFTLNLQQRWEAGSIVVDGDIDLIGFPVRVPIESGLVEWDRGVFRLMLATDPTAGPMLRFGGTGTPAELVVLDGLLLADPDPRLPFRIASWNAAWVGR